MAGTNKKKNHSTGLLVLVIFMGLGNLALIIRRLLHGHNVALFNPQGMIAKELHGLMMYTVIVLLAIAVPTLSLLYFVAWKYRESNTKAEYNPELRHSKRFTATLWLVPALFMLALALVMWPATHRLEPQKRLAAGGEPLTIQVISLRWKWLFIYPEQKIATVNFIQLPVNRPVQFEMTADEAPMNSFWIPNLAGQLYTMTGHINRLNMMADTPGDYPGVSAEINGAGFSGMKFIARASSAEEFDLWVKGVKLSPDVLDTAAYAKILAPSENEPAAFYSVEDSRLYDKVVLKYAESGGHHH